MTAAAEHPVIVAGAGPNGLMLACELALAGVHPVVLDQLPGPSSEPKANGLVGQVVRMLDLRGLYNRFSGVAGPPQPVPAWMFSGMALDLSMSFTGARPNPMYLLPVAQPQLVRQLLERAGELGVEVRWGHRLTGLATRDDAVVAKVSSPDGDYLLRTDYLVGADGGHSIVRKTAGIAFPGTTAPTVSRLAHVHIPERLRAADRSLRIPGFGRIAHGHNRFDNGMVIFGELEPDRSLLGTLEFGRSGDTGPMTLAELRQSLQRILGVDVAFAEPPGPGPHALRRIDGQNSRQAEHYRAGRVLLLGDAAHVHSAMGGPGLNLGLQDTANLGWKLAAQINGWAPDGLLDTYESERQPLGQRVMMHSMAQTALISPGPHVAALRELFGELTAIPAVSAHLAELLAGSHVRYDVGDDHRLSGWHVPDLTFDDGSRVAELLHRGRAVLLDLSDGTAAAAARPWADRVDATTAAMSEPPAAAMLIRPDGYVAWATDDFDSSRRPSLEAALSRWFGAPRP
ncbi:FAD-dependent monooxygenase [Mycolicibacter heraklionensis]|nr:FAD-dependent monooxygenase [Mycolicibacter heraklionensis]